MTNGKSEYKIITEGGREYILASQASDYVKEQLGTSFSVPSYRTIRYYVTEGIIDRPKKLKRETYFDLEYVCHVLQLLHELQTWGVSLSLIKKIIFNIRRFNAFDAALARLEAAQKSWIIKMTREKEFLHQLRTMNPKLIKIRDIEALKSKEVAPGDIPWD